MKLVTTFWAKETHDFYELLFINNKTEEIILSTDLNNKIQSSIFFKSVAELLKTRKFLAEMRSLWTGKSDVFYQFAVRKNNDILRIVWFDLVINERITVSHDVAFRTALIKKIILIFHLENFQWFTKTVDFQFIESLKLKQRPIRLSPISLLRIEIGAVAKNSLVL